MYSFFITSKAVKILLVHKFNSVVEKFDTLIPKVICIDPNFKGIQIVFEILCKDNAVQFLHHTGRQLINVSPAISFHSAHQSKVACWAWMISDNACHVKLKCTKA